MTHTHSMNRRVTDESPSAGQFEFDRLVRSANGGKGMYPCEAHADWLRRLDERLWAIVLVTCCGAIASLVGLLIQLSHKG